LPAVPLRTVAQEDEEEALLREDARAALWPENGWLEGRGFLDTDEEERLIEVGIEAARFEQEGRLREQGRAPLVPGDDWLEGHLLVAEEEERGVDTGDEADDHARLLGGDEEEQSMQALIDAALVEQEFSPHERWPEDPGDESDDPARGALAQADDDDEGQLRDAGAWGIVENDWEEELMTQMGVKIEEEDPALEALLSTEGASGASAMGPHQRGGRMNRWGPCPRVSRWGPVRVGVVPA